MPRKRKPEPYSKTRRIPSLYEAAFHFDNIAVRADILVRQPRKKFDLIEVKSTTGWKEHHLFDLAVQLYVLEGAGIRVGHTCLMHLNNGYVYGGGDYDLEELFTCADLTEQVRALQPDVVTGLAAMREAIRADNPPPHRNWAPLHRSVHMRILRSLPL